MLAYTLPKETMLGNNWRIWIKRWIRSLLSDKLFQKVSPNTCVTIWHWQSLCFIPSFFDHKTYGLYFLLFWWFHNPLSGNPQELVAYFPWFCDHWTITHMIQQRIESTIQVNLMLSTCHIRATIRTKERWKGFKEEEYMYCEMNWITQRPQK